MSFRERLAVHLAPWPLRFALAATFIWVGLGKIDAKEPVKPGDIAALTEMGVLQGTPLPAVEPKASGAKVEPPANGPSSKPESSTPKTEPKVDPKPSAPPPPLKKDGNSASRSPASFEDKAASVVLASQPAAPDELIRRLHPSIGVRVYQASRGVVAGEEKTGWVYWPAFLGKGSWPVYQAWFVSLVELIGGGLLLIGLFTRFAAFMLVGAMLGAMWLTQIGPALATGNTVLGFLPAHEAYDVRAWMPFFWQLSLLGGSMALALAGPGSLSLDRWLGRTSDDGDLEDGE